MNNYGLPLWGYHNFVINQRGLLCVHPEYKIPLLDIVSRLQSEYQFDGPILLRFPHLLEKQLQFLYHTFARSIRKESYQGAFHAVFPLKVNPYQQLVSHITRIGKAFHYGMEAGSKAELILAMLHTPKNAPITINGFKDEAMVNLAFIAAQMGYCVYLIIEGIDELNMFIKTANNCRLKKPYIGIRTRLHRSGSGNWAKSGGMNAKFGLTSTELLNALDLLTQNSLIDNFKMLHFHIGSQNTDIFPIKHALREAANIYSELKKMGASGLNSINIGGGLPIEYAQHVKKGVKNYHLEEFSNDVVFIMKTIMDAKGVAHPHIYTESGRYIVATHAVLVAPVRELFSQDYHKQELRLKADNPPLITEMRALLKDLNRHNCIEYAHDALTHVRSVLNLFDLGYVDLQDRSNAEILVHQIIKKTLELTQLDLTPEMEQLQGEFQERYLINASLFQSLPDAWGLQQRFPVMPIHHLKKKALRPATLWDITCDSDGEISFCADEPLYLHDIDLEKEDYFLAFFNVGAYQEVLGMAHNLFPHPHEATITLDTNNFQIIHTHKSDNLHQTYDNLGYSGKQLIQRLQQQIKQTPFDTDQEQQQTWQILIQILHENSYLVSNNRLTSCD